MAAPHDGHGPERPDYQSLAAEIAARVARRLGGERAEHERRATRERRAQLSELADLREVPPAPALRELVLRADLGGPALEAVRGALSFARRRRSTGGPVLVLSGDPGTGKTVALAWAAAHYEPEPLARRPPGSLVGCAARFAYASDVARLARAQWGAEAEQYRVLAGARLLCLDEAGIESDPGAIAELLIRRIAEERVTLLASNLTLAQLSERYLASGAGAGRLQSRLAAQQLEGLPWCCELEGADQRLA
jgi:hypothetical protein